MAESSSTDTPTAAATTTTPSGSGGSNQDQGEDHDHILLKPLDLFTEAAEATMCCAGVFMLADLRSLALPQKSIVTGQHVGDQHSHHPDVTFEDANEILELPIQSETIQSLNAKHKNLLQRKRSGDFEDIIMEYMESQNRSRSMEVFFVGDDNSHKECVYFIGRDHYRHCICLVFRGSITPNDWSQDVKAIIDEIPNPIISSTTPNTSSTVGIHWGFRNYLHGNSFEPLPKPVKDVFFVGKTSSASSVPAAHAAAATDGDDEGGRTSISDVIAKSAAAFGAETEAEQLIDSEGEDDSGGYVEDNEDSCDDTASQPESSSTTSKMQLILRQLYEMKSLYPNDPIFITGHSLGGALSLVAALSVASDPKLNQPINIVSKRNGSGESGHDETTTTSTTSVSVIPVTVVAVANPKVGNQAFNDAILELERGRLLRCLCIHNDHDIVGMMTPPNFNKLRPDRNFCTSHPGFRLLLYSDQKFKIGRGNVTDFDDDDDNDEVDEVEVEGDGERGDVADDGIPDDLSDSSSKSGGSGSGKILEWGSVSAKSHAKLLKKAWTSLKKEHKKWTNVVRNNVTRNRHDYRLYLERIIQLENKGLKEISISRLYEESNIYTTTSE